MGCALAPGFITFPVLPSPGSPSLALVRLPSSSTSSVVDVLFPVASRVAVHPLIGQDCVACQAK